MNIAAMLLPTALSAVGSLFSSGKDKEKEQGDSKYQKLAEAAISAISRGTAPALAPSSSYNQAPVPMPANVSIGGLVGQFQEGLMAGQNPVMAGLSVARNVYDNRGKLKDELLSKAKSFGGWAKNLWSKVWDNKGAILEGVGDMLLKRPRLA